MNTKTVSMLQEKEQQPQARRGSSRGHLAPRTLSYSKAGTTVNAFNPGCRDHSLSLAQLLLSPYFMPGTAIQEAKLALPRAQPCHPVLNTSQANCFS